MKKNKRTIIIILLCLILICTLILFLFSRLGSSDAKDGLSFEYSSYRDIPGVTAEEIAAIETLKEQIDFFVHASTFGTEAFLKEDGQIGGYITLFCDWLSSLFEIPFIPRIHGLDDLYANLNSGGIDFAGMTVAPQFSDLYFSSDPIAKRSVKIMQIKNSQPPHIIAMYRLPRFIFLEGSVTFNDVSALLEPGSFEAIFSRDYNVIYEMLRNGDADAFIAMDTAAGAFDSSNYMVFEDFFPLIFNPVTMTARNQAYLPIISVVTKALQNGGIQHLTNLYSIGYREYIANVLWKRLNEEEKEYIKDNPVIKIGAQYYNYPIDFYNTHEREWQGIIFDVLNEVSLLTGLSFEVVTDINIEWPQLLQALETGEISFVPQLSRTPAREGRFLWPQTVMMKEHYLLISRTDFPDLLINDFLSAKVGLVKDFSHTVMFHNWFPNHPYIIEYDDFNSATIALERGEVDVMMGSMIQLLSITNYQERVGFKVNFLFNHIYDIYPGFNKNEAVLLSILDKALVLIDIYRISDHWMRKTFDYRAKLILAQRPWLFGAIGLSLIIIVLVSAFFARSRYASKELGKLVVLRTEALAASNSKSAFLATMSHEMRTPMNAIIGMTAIGKKAQDIDQKNHALNKIGDASSHLLGVINDVLDMEKIEADKLELSPIEFDFRKMLQKVITVIGFRIDEKQQVFSMNVDSKMPRFFVGDDQRLAQVITNLLSNAVKFTPDGGKINIMVSMIKERGGNCELRIEVADNGIGISAEQQERLFLPFEQAESGTSRKYGGTGLGLVISKRIIELMGGRIWVESEPAKGARFIFTVNMLNVKENDGTMEISKTVNTEKSADSVTDVMAKTEAAASVFEGKRLLLAEDIEINREILIALLENSGLIIECAENGQEAVDMIEASPGKYDVVFMDIQMPKMDGLEATQRIREFSKKIPIVAMTANVFKDNIDSYLAAGMDDHLGKPLDIDRVFEKLRKYLIKD
ncbi:MAG: response regulator [Treponema sp.]|jgi:signal transduction histidine kinase/ActR/RegA family two-component response regulator|nr:response regulator [Treponema sp.]